MLVQLFTVVMIARLLGPEGNGQYAVALLLPMVLVTLLNLGIGPANVYFLGSRKVSIRKALYVSVVLWIMLAAVGVVLGYASVKIGSGSLFPGIDVKLLWFSLGVFPLGLLLNFNLSLLQGLERFREFNFVSLVQPITTMALIVFAYIREIRQVEYIIAFYIVGLIVAVLVSLYITRPGSNDPANDSDAHGYFGRVVNYGYKVHISNILAFINYKADIFLINYFINPGAAGIYVVAVQLVEKLWLLSQSVSVVILPRLSQLADSEDIRKQITPVVCRWVMAATLMGGVLLAVLAYPCIELLFGQDYIDAVIPLMVLLPGVLAISGAKVLANDIAARGRPELNMYTSWGVVLVNLTGNIIMIPRYGLLGAAAATSIAYILNLLLRLVLYSKLSGNAWRHSVLLTFGDIKKLVSTIKNIH